ncbi:MAG: hypothetical protein ACK5JD_13640 [Mangrovibacterium sp.]
MLQPLLQLYYKLEGASQNFIDAGLKPIAFIDIYRSQPLQPELYEYFPLPAVFVDYTMRGNGINQPRTVAMTLHIVTDELPDASNISEQKQDGLKRFLYNLLIQDILEGGKLGITTKLKFISEEVIDIPVANYHPQAYEFDAYLADMMGNTNEVLGQFETLNIFGSLLQTR